MYSVGLDLHIIKQYDWKHCICHADTFVCAFDIQILSSYEVLIID